MSHHIDFGLYLRSWRSLTTLLGVVSGTRSKPLLQDFFRNFFLFAVALICNFALARPQTESLLTPQNTVEKGPPFLQNYSYKDHGFGAQNWGLIQDKNGLIIVNNQAGGVLIFDGVRWRRVVTDQAFATSRSLAMDAHGRIYVGGVGEIGYLEADAKGDMAYVSLMPLIPKEEREFLDVWNILIRGDEIYFNTFSKLIRVQGKQVKVWKPNGSFHYAYLCRGQVFIRELEHGLLRLENDQLIMTADGEKFAKNKIYTILPWPFQTATEKNSSLTNQVSAGKMLVGARNIGWSIYDGTSFTPWPTDADEIIKRHLIYDAKWLRDGRLAVATLLGGVYILDAQGHLVDQIDKSDGLYGNDIKSLFEDKQGNLWLTSGTGITQININSPFSYFGDRSSLEGAISAITRHQGKIYVGTAAGLFRLEAERPGRSHFVSINGASFPTWVSKSVDDQLLIGNYDGFYVMDKLGIVSKIEGGRQNTQSIWQAKKNPNRVYLGHAGGIMSARREGEHWITEDAIVPAIVTINSLYEDSDGDLWCGTDKNGVLRIHFPPDWRSTNYKQQAEVQIYTADHGLPTIFSNKVVIIHGEMRVTTEKGIYQFDPKNNRFTSDPDFKKVFENAASSINYVSESGDGRLWIDAVDQNQKDIILSEVQRQKNGDYQRLDTRLGPFNKTKLEALYSDPDGVLWIGGSDALIRYDPRVRMPNSSQFVAHIRRVSDAKQNLIYGGDGGISPPHLAFNNNSLRFEIGTSSYRFPESNQFQMRLVGLDQEWSKWSTESYRDYTNIPSGVFQFEVRTRDAFGVISPITRFNFEVLYPWYRQWWAYCLFAIALMGAIGGLIRWRLWALREQNRELENQVAARTADLETAKRSLQAAVIALEEQNVTDPLTGLRNRRFLSSRMSTDIAEVNRAHVAYRSDTPINHHLNTDMVFVMVDLDFFKSVNDDYGHAAGDRVLEQTAEILREATRDTDTVVRWGGEEFLIVGRKANRAEVNKIAERIRSKVEAYHFNIGAGQILRKTCSIGLAVYPFVPQLPEAYAWEQVVAIADQCLYAAKRGGRNAWVALLVAEGIDDAVLVENNPIDVPKLIADGVLIVNTSLAKSDNLDWSHG